MINCKINQSEVARWNWLRWNLGESECSKAVNPSKYIMHQMQKSMQTNILLLTTRKNRNYSNIAINSFALIYSLQIDYFSDRDCHEKILHKRIMVLKVITLLYLLHSEFPIGCFIKHCREIV